MNQTPIVEELPDENIPKVDPGESDQPAENPLAIPSISTKQLLILVAILTLALIVWRVRRDRKRDEEDRKVVEDDSIEGIYVPENPDDPLRADSAVISGLKDAGVMG